MLEEFRRLYAEQHRDTLALVTNEPFLALTPGEKAEHFEAHVAAQERRMQDHVKHFRQTVCRDEANSRVLEAGTAILKARAAYELAPADGGLTGSVFTVKGLADMWQKIRLERAERVPLPPERQRELDRENALLDAQRAMAEGPPAGGRGDADPARSETNGPPAQGTPTLLSKTEGAELVQAGLEAVRANTLAHGVGVGLQLRNGWDVAKDFRDIVGSGSAPPGHENEKVLEAVLESAESFAKDNDECRERIREAIRKEPELLQELETRQRELIAQVEKNLGEGGADDARRQQQMERLQELCDQRRQAQLLQTYQRAAGGREIGASPAFHRAAEPREPGIER